MELILAALENLKIFFIAACFASSLASILYAIRIFAELSVDLKYGGEKEADKYASAKKTFFRITWLPVIFGALICIPTINDLWKVRIALIKYHLAAPDNFKQTTDTIERIGKKLECKYLGCDDRQSK